MQEPRRHIIVTDLIDVMGNLRRLPNAARRSFHLDAGMLASGYLQTRANAPRRAQGYFSASRSGVTSSGAFTSRIEEHLAIGLWRRGELPLPNGERLRLLDYQTH